MMRIRRLAPEVDGVPIGEEQLVVTQANRIKGAAATLAIDPVVEILGEDEAGAAENTGTPSAAVLKISLPRGRRGFDLAGDWDSETEYAAYQAVTHENSTWFALVANDGVEPGTNVDTWHLLLDGSPPLDAQAAAEAAASDAEDARDLAIGARDDAITAKDDAEDASALADGSADDAAAAAALAQAWAAGTLPGGVGTKSAREFSEDADGAADLAAAWAAGTLPGGPGTKSAREYAEEAAAAVDVEASAVAVTPAGGISSTDVQAALEELDSEKALSSHTHAVGDLAGLTQSRVVGRASGAGSGAAQELTGAQLRAIANVADGATANATDAQLRDRSTHTGTQARSTVDGLQAALDALSERTTGFIAASPITASGAAVVIADLDCDDIIVFFNGVSHNNGANTALNAYYSTNNGGSWSSAMAISASVAASATLGGAFAMRGLREGNAVADKYNLLLSGSFPGIVLQSTTPTIASIIAGGQINALKFEWAAGAFDAGTIPYCTRG